MAEILKKLIHTIQDGEFHSGEKLGKILSLTRSAVWKIVKQLRNLDIEIESITNKGYRIPGGLSLLEEKKIYSHLEKEQLALLETLEIFDSLPSTNDYLLQHSSSLFKNKTVACFAERQTQGKGRLGRTWVSPFGKNIYVSVLWHFPRDPSELSGLSLAMAIAVVETLKQFGIQENIHLKWPNDILWKNQKLSGILLELTCETHNITPTVIGVGLNVEMPNLYSEQITQPWVDVFKITEQKIDRNALAGALLNTLLKALTTFQNEGLAPFIPTWQSLDSTFNQPVSIMTPIAVLQGIGRGINKQGHFLLETNGIIKNYSSGEISILKNHAS